MIRKYDKNGDLDTTWGTNGYTACGNTVSPGYYNLGFTIDRYGLLYLAQTSYLCSFLGNAKVSTGEVDITGNSGTITFDPYYLMSTTSETSFLLDMSVSGIADGDRMTIDFDGIDSITGLTSEYAINLTGNASYTTHAKGAGMSSASNQSFAFGQATTSVSAITITDFSGAITASNDIRIAIATTAVSMLWDTTDTVANISGAQSSKASAIVSYEDNASVLVIDITSDFAINDSITISGVSFVNFTEAVSATSALELHIDGGVDSSPASIDDKTVAIYGTLTLANSSQGVTLNKWPGETSTSTVHYSYSLLAEGETISLGETIFNLSSVSGIVSSDITDAILFFDTDENGEFSDGILDSWGDSESGIITVSNSAGDDYAQAITMDSDNNIYVAGYYYNTTNADTDWMIRKYDANGDLDTTWGDSDTGIIIVSNDNGSDGAFAITLDSSNAIYVAGNYYNASNADLDWMIRKYDANGDLDTTWGDSDSGIVTVSSNDGSDFAYTITIDSSNSIYIAGGYYDSGNADYDWMIRKYNANGDLDTTWGDSDSGIIVVVNDEGIITNNEVVYGITIDSSNAIYVTGYGVGLTRKYDANGDLDTTWGDSDTGIVSVSCYAITIDSSNSIYIAENNADWIINKYDANGDLDTTWGDSDSGTITVSNSGTDLNKAITIDSSNAIYVAGYYYVSSSDDDWMIRKYDSSGDIDTSWGDSNSGIVSVSNNAGDDSALAITIDSNKAIYLAGYYYVSSTDDWMIRKYTPETISTGVVSINDTSGTIIFSDASHVIGTTSGDYYVDLTVSNIENGDTMTIDLGSIVATGTVSDYAISYVGDASSTTHAKGTTISSASDQVFAVGQATTSISAITITDFVGGNITASNDIRIAIATSAVGMLWDTTDTTATISGDQLAKVSSSVTYDGDGSVLVINVTSDFDAFDAITISGLSFVGFTEAASSTGLLELHIDGGVDSSSASTDDKLLTVYGALTLQNASTGVTPNKWPGETSTSTIHYSYSLLAEGETMSLGETVFNLSNVNGVVTSDISDVKLYVDYNKDGLLDYTILDSNWGDSDSGIITASSSASDDSANAIIVDSNNAIYVAGYYYDSSNADNDWMIRKYDSSGDLDTTWGNSDSGIITVSNNNGADKAYAITTDSNNAIYVAGGYYVSNSDWMIRKYDANGDLDTTWGDSDSGVIIYDTLGEIYDITSDSNNAIYVVGYKSNSTMDWMIRKYDANGDLDTTWGDSDTGVISVVNNDGVDLASAITIDSNNAIYVAGGYYNLTNTDRDWMIRKYDSSGDLDITWGDSDTGIVTVSSDAGGDEIYGITIDSNNAIYTAGYYYSATNADYDWMIRKYDSSGDLDTTWGDSDTGIIIASSTAGHDYAYDITIDSSNAIYVAGYYYDSSNADKDWMIRKYDANGDLDTTWGESDTGIVTVSSAAGDDSIQAIVIDSNNTIYVAGYYYDSSNANQDWMIRKYSSELVANGAVSISNDSGTINLATSSNYYMYATSTDFYLELTASNIADGVRMTIDFTSVEATGAVSAYPITLTGDASSTTHAKGTTISSASNQVFEVGQATTSMSAITITDYAGAITVSNDIRIAIATDTVGMLWDTTQDTATISGDQSSKVSTSVTYDGGGSVLLINVSSDFEMEDTITISGLSFTSFTEAASSTGLLELHIDGGVDSSPASTDDKVITLYGALTLQNNSAGPITNKWPGETSTSTIHYSYSTVAEAEPVNFGETIFNLSGVSGVVTSDVTVAQLYIDYNNNGEIEGSLLSQDWGDSDSGVITYSNDAGDDAARAVVLDSKGSVYVAGYSGYNWVIRKFNTYGDLDIGWGDDDSGIITASSAGYARSMVIDSSNNIYVFGQISPGVSRDWMIRKYDSNGDLDTTWGDSDSGIISFINSGVDDPYAIAIDSDNAIYAAGNYDCGSGYCWMVRKYDANGDLDTTWGDSDSGIVTSEGGGYDTNYAQDITIDSSNAIYVAGAYYNSDNLSDDWMIRKYDVNGDLDTTWGDSDTGIITVENVNTNRTDSIYSITIDSSNDIYAAGYYFSSPSSYNMIRKYNSSGDLDTTWGDSDSGIVTSESGLFYNYALNLDPDGSIYVAGFYSQDIAIFKYDSSGNLDTTWGDSNSGMVSFDSGGIDWAYDLALNSGSLYIAGSYYNSSNDDQDWMIRKYNQELAIDGQVDISGNSGTITFATSTSYGNYSSNSTNFILNLTASNIDNGDRMTIDFGSAEATGLLSGYPITLTGDASSTTHAKGVTISSASDQAFAIYQATTTISAITVADYLGGSITASNDIRIAIATTSVPMLWDTTDTTATISGDQSSKVSATVSYEMNGEVLVIDVTSDFAIGDNIIISGLSFADFTEVATSTDVLQLHIDGGVDSSPVDTDDKVVTIHGSLVLANHSDGPILNQWPGETSVDTINYSYSLVAEGEIMTLGETVFSLSDIRGVVADDITDAMVFVDYNDNNRLNNGIPASWGDSNSGIVAISNNDGDDFSNAITIDSNNAIYVAGEYENSTNSDTDWMIRKYDANGDLDTTWGDSDSGIIVISSDTGDDHAYAITIDSSNAIYVAGYFNDSTLDWMIRKYDANGDLDTTWGDSDTGIITVNGSGIDMAHAIAIDSSNAIYVAGEYYNSSNSSRDWMIRKYDANGDLDTTWGDSDTGIVMVNNGDGNEAIYAITIDSSNAIFVAGDYYSLTNTATDWMIRKYDANGDLDTTWGDSDTGIITVSNDIAWDQVNAIAIDSSNAIYVAGGYSPISTPPGWMIRKYDANGDLDTTWGDSDTGIIKVFHDDLNYDEANDITIDSSNAIYVTGHYKNTNNNDLDWMIRKYDANGDLDTTWGDYNSGIVAISNNDGDDELNAITIDSSNAIYVAGEYENSTNSDTDWMIRKYIPELIIDGGEVSINGSSGSITFSNPVDFDINSTSEDFYLDFAVSNIADGDKMIIDLTSVEAIGQDSNYTISYTGDASSTTHAKGVTISSAADQTFEVGQATTSISAITITDYVGSITASNDIRIAIATSAVGMLWNTADTTATISGNQSSKVSTSVTYDGSGSVLVVDVTSNFEVGDTITISGLSFIDFTKVASSTGILELYVGGLMVDTDDKLITVYGTLDLENHVLGPVENKWLGETSTTTVHYSYSLVSEGESMTLGETVFSLSEVRGVVTDDITNVQLYIDTYDDGKRNTNTTDWTRISYSAGIVTWPGTALIHRITSMANINNTLYIGTFNPDEAEVYRYDGGKSWTKISQETAGTISLGGTSGIDSVWSMANVDDVLYIGTYESGAAEVYRYDGDTNWTLVSSSIPGVITSGGTSDIDYIGSMISIDGTLYIGTSKLADAEVYRYDGGTTWSKVSQEIAGTISSDGSSSINTIESMANVNGILYIGTAKVNFAEVYRYEGDTTWTLVSSSTPGTISLGGTNSISSINSMISVNNTLYIGTDKTGGAEVYRYDGDTTWTLVSSSTPGTISLGGTNSISSIGSMISVNNTLYIGTTGGAEVYRYDGDTTWTLVSSSTPGIISSGVTNEVDDIICMANVNNTLYAGTQKTAGGEVYRYDFEYQVTQEANVVISSDTGTITFATSSIYYILATTTNFILQLDAANIANGDKMTIDFSSIVAAGTISAYPIAITGDASSTTHAKGISISSAANQTFEYNQATTSISAITITDYVGSITASNDIRIAIATSAVGMLWNTTDTTATISGNQSSKVDTSVTYDGSGSVMVVDVTSNFTSGDTITISGLSFVDFTEAASSTGLLELHIDGGVDSSPVSTDNKHITVYGLLTMANASTGVTSNKWPGETSTTTIHYSYSLLAEGEDITLGETVFNLSGINGVVTGDVSDVTMFVDRDGDGEFNPFWLYPEWGDSDTGAVIIESDDGGDVVNDIAIDSSNAIYAVGNYYSTTYSDNDWMIRKYDANGDLDTTWGDSDTGIITVSNDGTDNVQAIAIDSSNAIYVAGNYYSSVNTDFDWMIRKYDANGDLDTTWGDSDSGIITVSNNDGNDTIQGIAKDSSNAIYVAGYSYLSSSSYYNWRIRKYDANGDLDTTWGDSNTGIITYTSTDGSDYLNDITIDSSNAIYVGGKLWDSVNLYSRWMIIKYNSDGDLDTTWGDSDSGIIVVNVFGSNTLYSVKVDSSNAIYVGGNAYNSAIGHWEWMIKKYDANGDFDTTWGDSDTGSTTVSNDSSNVNCYDLALDSDNNMFAVGNYSGDWMIRKYDSSGDLDTTWGGSNTGYIIVSAGSSPGDIAIGSNDVIYVGGSYYNTTNEDSDWMIRAYNVVTEQEDIEGEVSITGSSGTISFATSTTYNLYATSTDIYLTFTASNIDNGDKMIIDFLSTEVTGVASMYPITLTGDASSTTHAKGTTISSASDQVFAVGQATTSISAITIADYAGIITSSNDIRIAIATSAVGMLWDTTDTTAIIGGGQASKVSTTVSYDGAGSVLVIDVTSDFETLDSFTISGLSFVDFTEVATSTGMLELHIDGGVDSNPVDTDEKTITVYGAINLGNASGGSISNKWPGETSTSTVHYSYSLVTEGEVVNLGNTTFNLSDIVGVETSDITDVQLYIDYNGNSIADGVSVSSGWGDTDTGIISVSSNDGYDYARAMSVDLSNAIYVAGDYYDSTNTDNDWMIRKYNSSGDLDTTWGSSDSGIITVSNNNGNDYARAMSIDSNNAIYVAGDYYDLTNTDQDWMIRKYDANGDLDTTWGDSNSGIITVSNNNGSDYARAIAIDSDNAIYVTGDYYNSTNSDNDWMIRKYDSGGDLDTTWGSSDSGIITVSSDINNDSAYAITVDSDKAIYVAGEYYDLIDGDYNWMIRKYDANGDLDTTWGDSDTGIITISNTGNDSIRAITTDSVNAIYVAGDYYSSVNADNDWMIRKYDANGDLDTTWGDSNSGIVAVSNNGGADYAYTISMDVFYSIYVAGVYFSSANVDDDWMIHKYDSNGDIDTSWGDSYTGTLTVSNNNDDYAHAMVIDSYNHIYVAGEYYSSTNADHDWMIRKYNGPEIVSNGQVSISGTSGTITLATSNSYIYDTPTNIYLDLTASNIEDGDRMAIDFASVSGTGLTSSYSPISYTGDASSTLHAKGVFILSASDQVFEVGQATTTISTITIEDRLGSSITAGNDIRIAIATSVAGMLWDTTDLTATIGGAQSSKVSTTVSYDGGGSVLVIDVTSDFVKDDVITISGLSFADFIKAASTSNLSLHIDGGVDGSPVDSDDKSIIIHGILTASNHSQGVISNKWSGGETFVSAVHYAYSLIGEGEKISLATTTLTLTGISGVFTSDISGAWLYLDIDGDAEIDSNPIATGTVYILDSTGVITFVSPSLYEIATTTATDFIVKLDASNLVNLSGGGEQLSRITIEGDVELEGLVQLETGFTFAGDTMSIDLNSVTGALGNDSEYSIDLSGNPSASVHIVTQ